MIVATKLLSLGSVAGHPLLLERVRRSRGRVKFVNLKGGQISGIECSLRDEAGKAGMHFVLNLKS